MRKNKIGLPTLIAIVIGTTIGSGIFMLPASLARIGSIGLLSWIFTIFGAFLIAICFSKLSFLIPKHGGPYAYAREGLGDCIGFQTAYIYWISLWAGNASIAVACVGYARFFFPILANPTYSLLLSISVIWMLVMVNAIGVRSMGLVQIITTLLKFLPIILVIIIAAAHFHPEYLTHNFNISGKPNISAFSYAATLTLWAFVGIEAATVPAGNIKNPGRNIPLATLIGTLVVSILYFASSSLIMGALPINALANSTAPFADVIAPWLGKWGALIAAAGAAISCFGSLNGEILLAGHVPYAAAQDGLFPKIFAKCYKPETPIFGFIISGIFMTIMLIMTNNPNLVDQFQVLILVAATSTLIAYLFSAVAEIIILAKNKATKLNKTNVAIALCATFYCFWAIFGSGKDVIFYMTILIFSGFPLYALLHWFKMNKLP